MMGIMTTTVDSSDSMPERLQEGSVAPDFTLPAVIPGFTESGSINLSDVLDAGRRVVLYFYPAAMTPGCTTEACDFRDNLARLASKNVTVLGVSKDSRDKLRKFAQRDHLTFPLLSDPDLTVHKLYGAYGEKKLYGKVHVGVIRSTLGHQYPMVPWRLRATTCVPRTCRFAIKALEKLEKLESSAFSLFGHSGSCIAVPCGTCRMNHCRMRPPVDFSDSPANSETVGAQYVYGWHVIERCCGGIEHQFADGGGC